MRACTHEPWARAKPTTCESRRAAPKKEQEGAIRASIDARLIINLDVASCCAHVRRGSAADGGDYVDSSRYDGSILALRVRAELLDMRSFSAFRFSQHLNFRDMLVSLKGGQGFISLFYKYYFLYFSFFLFIIFKF